ncbi:MAG TPA: hypothetical protein VM534_01210 [Thermoanaerobaculia bacterium]|nr:hypothetical protein [Thermoanaerobaculia bacterium]
MPALVLTIRTTIAGDDRNTTHRLLVHEDRVRATNELDRWRLFDFRQRTVTTVDDIARTWRVTSFDTLMAKRRALVSASRPQLPAAEIRPLPGPREIAGISASGYEIRLGGYRRELWLSSDPLIHPDFFPVMVAAEAADPDGAAVMREVDPVLRRLRGFPLLDRSEMRIDNELLTIERRLIRRGKTDVPLRWFAIPSGYVEETSRTARQKDP